jgi:RNA polymerase sigma-70 factor (ECF subfamily)
MRPTRSRRRQQVALDRTSPEKQPSAAPIFRIVPPVDETAQSTADDALLDADVPDDALIAAIVAGEAAGLGPLYDRHGHAVFALIVRIVGDRGSAEDLLQEVFLRAWQRAYTFDDTRGTVRSWLHGIAHHLALNELRHRHRRPQVLTPPPGDARDEEDGNAAYVDPVADPAGDAWCAVRDATMGRAFAELPEAQREVLALYAAGFSQTEIAATLNQPLGTIKSRMRRGLCRLRETLPEIGIDASWPKD